MFGRRPKRSASGDLRRQPAAIVCEQKFSTTANVHDIDLRFWHSCDMCERKFKEANNLKRHRANVHDIDVRWHSCDMCEQTFKYAGHLKRHRAFVHDIDVRWHSCDMCERKFKSVSNL